MTNKQLEKLIAKTIAVRVECAKVAKMPQNEDFRQRLLLQTAEKCRGWSMSAENDTDAEILLKNTFDRIDASVDFREKFQTLSEEEQKEIRSFHYPMKNETVKAIFAAHGLEIKQYDSPYIE